MQSTEVQLIHDLRNVAAIIRGAAETLQSDGPTLPPESSAHVASMLARRSDMLVRLIDDLATVHELNHGGLALQLQAVDLADAVRDVVADHHKPGSPMVIVEIDPGTIALADPVRVIQILDNLLSNALRYGGSVVCIRAWRDAGQVVVTVVDDGDGIAAGLVDTMFAPHTRGSTSRLFGGSGLGLAIVRQLCHALGGGVEYDRRLGTTFTVRLPAVATTSADLGADAARQGHSVSFWKSHAELADAVAGYAVAGLVAGEAVVLAMTEAHQGLVEERLAELGVDVAAAKRLGQYVRLDAAAIHDGLVVGGHIDTDRFTDVVGGTIEAVEERWLGFRVFGEIVDLYWREGDQQLALELETCWNRLRARIDFPLYCGYELAPGQDEVCGCHDAVLTA